MKAHQVCPANEWHLPAPKEPGEKATEKLQLPPCNFVYILKNKPLFGKCNIDSMQNAMENVSFSAGQGEPLSFCTSINKLK